MSEFNGTVKEALAWATEAHGDQKYGHMPYSHHLREVTAAVRDAGWDERYQIVAALHDAIEDTEITHEAIAERFGADVADAIQAMSRPGDGSSTRGPDAYIGWIIDSVLPSRMASVVKLWDVRCNLAGRPGSVKYKRANTILTLAVGCGS